jgi:hypothetical protein
LNSVRPTSASSWHGAKLFSAILGGRHAICSIFGGSFEIASTKALNFEINSSNRTKRCLRSMSKFSKRCVAYPVFVAESRVSRTALVAFTSGTLFLAKISNMIIAGSELASSRRAFSLMRSAYASIGNVNFRRAGSDLFSRSQRSTHITDLFPASFAIKIHQPTVVRLLVGSYLPAPILGVRRARISCQSLQPLCVGRFGWRPKPEPYRFYECNLP